MPLKPPPRTKMEYEKVKTDDWTQGIIEDVQHDEKRDTGFKDDDTGENKIVDSVRFKFKLDGYSYPHYSRWMTLSYHEKSNLFKKYITNLVEGAAQDLDFDLERLKGFPVKVMWQDNGDFQNVEMVRPLVKKIDPTLPF